MGWTEWICGLGLLAALLAAAPATAAEDASWAPQPVERLVKLPAA